MKFKIVVSVMLMLMAAFINLTYWLKDSNLDLPKQGMEGYTVFLAFWYFTCFFISLSLYANRLSLRILYCHMAVYGVIGILVPSQIVTCLAFLFILLAVAIVVWNFMRVNK